MKNSANSYFLSQQVLLKLEVDTITNWKNIVKLNSNPVLFQLVGPTNATKFVEVKNRFREN